MATESTFVWDESFVAAADYSTTGQFFPVKVTAARTVTICADDADFSIGVLQNKPKLGEAANVRLLGMSKVIADGSGTIAAGDPVAPLDSGHVATQKTADGPVLGYAMEAATADGQIISVLLVGPGFFRTAAS